MIQHKMWKVLKAGEVTTLYQRRSPQKLAVELNMPEKYFAEKVLNRSQGSFSDYLTKAPPTMPKSHSHGIWQRLQQFLESEEEQEELREQFREGKLNEPFISFWYRLCYVLYQHPKTTRNTNTSE